MAAEIWTRFRTDAGTSPSFFISAASWVCGVVIEVVEMATSRTADVERLAEGLDEALRRAGDERELDVIPVGADGVIDYRPALQDGVVGCVFGKDDAVEWISRRGLR